MAEAVTKKHSIEIPVGCAPSKSLWRHGDWRPSLRKENIYIYIYIYSFEFTYSVNTFEEKKKLKIKSVYYFLNHVQSKLHLFLGGWGGGVQGGTVLGNVASLVTFCIVVVLLTFVKLLTKKKKKKIYIFFGDPL